MSYWTFWKWLRLLGIRFFTTSQVVPGSITLTASSPYRTIVNSATAATVTLGTPPNNDARVIANVGAGTVTVSLKQRTGQSTFTIAQDNARILAYNAQLGYWTQE